MVQPVVAHIVGITAPENPVFPTIPLNVTVHAEPDTDPIAQHTIFFDIAHFKNRLVPSSVYEIIGIYNITANHINVSTSGEGAFEVSLTVPNRLKSFDEKSYPLIAAVNSTVCTTMNYVHTWTDNSSEVEWTYFITNLTVGRSF